MDLSEKSAVIEIAEILADFFKHSPAKIAVWLLMPNAQFGGVSPSVLVNAGCAWKVLKVMKDMREGNLP